MKKYVSTILICLIIFSGNIDRTGASSAGDEGTPPPPPTDSGGGGGGGAPQFFDYYVPLVFNYTHKHGMSEVVVFLLATPSIPSILITSFSLDPSGTNQIVVNEPTKFVFNPLKNRGLTNGSRIRTTSPALVTGQRITEDVYADYSFAYSILIDRMMGFEYIAPMDGWISVVSRTRNTQINVANPSKVATTWTIPVGELTMSIPVQEGAYINTTYPVNAAFISYKIGVSATMAVPGYLRGTTYMFDASITAPRSDEIEHSYISVFPEEPTELELRHEDGSIDKQVIFGPVKIGLTSSLRGINSSRGKINIALHIQYEYSGITRSSTVQLIAAPEMRAGEMFASPSGYTSHFISVNNNTQFATGVFNYEEKVYSLSSRYIFNRSSYEPLSFNGKDISHIIIGNSSAFGFLTSPGKVGHPQSPSLAFLNVPLNPQTNNENITGILATWYRFPNLAVKKIEIVPAPHEEYTGQTIKVEIISNGSLPASRFRLEIILDDETVVEETYDFLQVNDTLKFEFKRFIEYGISELNISVNVDVDDIVNEMNEDDNTLSYGIKIEKNIRLRWSIYGITIIFIVYVIIRIRRKFLAMQRSTRSHVDAIISFETEVEE